MALSWMKQFGHRSISDEVKARWFERAITLVDEMSTDLKAYWCQRLLKIIAEKTQYQQIYQEMGQLITEAGHQSEEGGAGKISL
jgi:hypothetical protein